MSEEKKAYMGAAYGAPEAKQAAADGGGMPPAGPPPGKEAEASPSSKGVRGQTVLPGILGKQLRAAYGELLNAPVPDRFNDLIKQLQRQEADIPAKPRGEEEST